MRITRTLLIAVFLLLIAVQAAAQTVGTIEIGETTTGAVTSTSTAPSYFFNAEANQLITLQLTTSDEDFMPVILVADEQNNVIETFSDAVAGRVGGTITIPADGRYFVQVQGANGTRGQFSLAILEGDIPLDVATPTPTPEPTVETEATAEADGTIELAVGDIVQSDFEQAERQFSLSTEDVPLLLQVFGNVGSTSLSMSLTSNASGDVVGSYRAPLTAGAFVVPPASGTYTLTVSQDESDPSISFVVFLSEFSGGDLLQPQEASEATLVPSPTLPPTTSATPTPPAPQDVDALLTWSATELMFTNISGARLDIRMLSFTGSGRSVDMSFWAQGNPTLDLSAFPPETCAGFRPLAYPDAPPLAPGCTDLAAWYSADIVHFWEGDSFDVRYNGSVIATCPTSDGQCGIDLPDA